MSSLQPPRLASRLFDWYSGHAHVEDLRGDLDENFYRNVKTKSLRKARMMYWKQVLSLLTSYALWKRKRKVTQSENSLSNQLTMLQNYFKIAFRNLIKQKYFAIINIIGLAVGMSISLLIIALFTFVSGYDDFHTNGDRIYRITSNITEGIESNHYATAPAALGERLKMEASSLEKMVRIKADFDGVLSYNHKEIPLPGYFTDPEFLQLFNFPLLDGNTYSVLNKPNHVVLTTTAAKKIFNQENAIGKIVTVAGIGECEVSGVLQDLPKNTHFDFELLISYSTLTNLSNTRNQREAWTIFPREYVYIQTKRETDLEALATQLKQLEKEIYTPADYIKASFHLQALDEITMGESLRGELGETWDLIGLVTFATLALLILLPACFNYANISIARALKRSKEIGLRKTLGGLKQQIFTQFITETIVIILLSLVLACGVFVLLRNEFQSMMVAANKLDLSLTPTMLAGFFLFAIGTGLCAGLAPALYFSKLNPIQALKGTGSSRTLSVSKVRKGLTVIQFVLSFSFIIGLVVFTKQYLYSLNFDLGFQQANIIDVPLQNVSAENFDAHFSSLAAIETISYSSGILGLSASQAYAYREDEKDSTEVSQLFVDDQFLHTFELSLLAGENFKKGEEVRERSMLVNEEFLVKHQLTNPVDAIGKVYRIDSLDLQIIGVVKNFHFTSLRLPITSFILRNNSSQFMYANLKVRSEDIAATFASLEQTWNTLSPTSKLEAKFFDEEIAESYKSYHTLLKITGFLGLLAISISCLGLLGMVVYTTENKTKEVGIRKVMGASATSITYLLSKEYLKLMLIAVLIATPLTWMLFDKMLSQLQYYRVSISVLDIVLSIAILMTLGLAAIATQTIRTAATNPATTLKYE